MEALIRMAPSIASEHPHPLVSDRYSFIRTIDMIPHLVETGWHPVRAREHAARSPGRIGYQKHEVSFRRESDFGEKVRRHFRNKASEHVVVKRKDGLEFFELRITNSHDRSAAWEFMIGIFVQLCSNGLVVSDATFRVEKLRHINLTPEMVRANALRAADHAGHVSDLMDRMKSLELREVRRLDFAERAIIAKYGNRDICPVTPDQVLIPRREEDVGNSLWRTYNVIQENIIQGLQAANRRDQFGRAFSQTNPVRALDRDIDLNKQLWEMAEGYLN